MYRVIIAQPQYNRQTNRDSLMAATMPETRREDMEVSYQSYISSALGCCFNMLWIHALQSPDATHFVMLHNDIVPESGWLDKLFDIQEARGDDLVSVAMSIKDNCGKTSCGIGDANSRWDTRRLTLNELYGLPTTFNQADTVASGFNPHNWPLVFNTGCWIADLRNQKWRETENGRAKFYFTMNDEIIQKDNGDWHVHFEPEDWFFSRLCNTHGIKYSITREVKAKHYGDAAYGNDSTWGTWQTDETWRKNNATKI